VAAGRRAPLRIAVHRLSAHGEVDGELFAPNGNGEEAKGGGRGGGTTRHSLGSTFFPSPDA